MHVQSPSMTFSALIRLAKHGILVAVIACASTVSSGNTAVALSELPKPFCNPANPIYNFLKPLENLPKVSGLAPSGKLKVGPPSLRIYPPRQRLVPIGLGGFTVRGAVVASGKPGHQLDWRVESRLVRISKKATSIELVNVRRQRVLNVDTFANREFGFQNNTRPGLYRLTIQIQTNKKSTETHQEYFRAVKPRSGLRLAKAFTTVAPGGVGYLRIDNYGTVSAGYGFGYQLWTEIGEEVPVEAIFPNIRLKLEPGHGGRCFPFEAPADLAPGKYRIGVRASDPLRGSEKLLSSFVEIGPQSG